MKLGERRVRDLVLGIIVAMLALWSAGCEGGGSGAEVDLPDGGEPTGIKSDAGVLHCEIPSPSGDIQMTSAKGSKSDTTMRQYYQHAAETGGAGAWGVVTNPSELGGLCAQQGVSSADCAGPAADPSTYCYYANCTWDASKGVQLCRLDGHVGKWQGDSRLVGGALCGASGGFAGWLCRPCTQSGPNGTFVCAHL